MKQVFTSIPDNKEIFSLEDSLENLIFQEFLSVGENGDWQINDFFDTIKYSGIEKFLKRMIGNIKSLYHLQENINKNMLVPKEDKEVVNNIMEILFEDKYYHSFLLEVFKNESERVKYNGKEDYLQGLSKHLFEKEKELNVLTFGILLKSYEREKSKEKGSIDFLKVFSLLPKLENRLEIEKEFLYQYKVIQRPREDNLESLVKGDLENICKALVEDKDFQEIETRAEKLKQSIEGGDEEDRKKLARLIEKLGFINAIVDELQKHEKILEKYTWSYEVINRVKKLHSKFDISSLLLDINIALTSKQKDIEASESHLVQEIKQEKEKEVQKSLFTFERKVKKEKENIIRELQEKKKALKKTLFAEVKYLKSLYYTLESTRKSFEESTQKVSYTFGKYYSLVEKIIENINILSSQEIGEVLSHLSVLKDDVEQYDMNLSIIDSSVGKKAKETLERKELYAQIVTHIDSGELFQVYINILRYRLLYGDDKDLCSVTNYIDEQNLILNYYEGFFYKLENGQSMEDEIKSMSHFIALLESGKFGSKDIDITKVKEDVEYLQSFFDSEKSIKVGEDDINLYRSSSLGYESNKYLESLMFQFFKKFDSHLKGSMSGNEKSLKFLIPLKEVGFCKKSFISFIETIEKASIDTIGNPMFSKLQIFGEYFESKEKLPYAERIIQEFFSDKRTWDGVKRELQEILMQTGVALKNQDWKSIDTIQRVLMKLRNQDLLIEIIDNDGSKDIFDFILEPKRFENEILQVYDLFNDGDKEKESIESILSSIKDEKRKKNETTRKQQKTPGEIIPPTKSELNLLESKLKQNWFYSVLNDIKQYIIQNNCVSFDSKKMQAAAELSEISEEDFKVHIKDLLRFVCENMEDNMRIIPFDIQCICDTYNISFADIWITKDIFKSWELRTQKPLKESQPVREGDQFSSTVEQLKAQVKENDKWFLLNLNDLKEIMDAADGSGKQLKEAVIDILTLLWEDIKNNPNKHPGYITKLRSLCKEYSIDYEEIGATKDDLEGRQLELKKNRYYSLVKEMKNRTQDSNCYWFQPDNLKEAAKEAHIGEEEGKNHIKEILSLLLEDMRTNMYKDPSYIDIFKSLCEEYKISFEEIGIAAKK